MYLLGILFIISSVKGNDVDCGLLNFGPPWAPFIGSLEYINSSTELGSVVKLRCARGYKLKGPEITKCASSGEWTVADTPSCQENSCSNPTTFPVEHGQIHGLRDEKTDWYSYGSAYAVSCDDGFRPEGSPVRICLDRGMWSNHTPRCVPRSGTGSSTNSSPDCKGTDSQPVSSDFEISYIYYIIIGVGFVYFLVGLIGNVRLILFVRHNTTLILINEQTMKSRQGSCGHLVGVIIAVFHFVLPFALVCNCCSSVRKYLGIKPVSHHERMSLLEKPTDEHKGDKDIENGSGGNNEIARLRSQLEEKNAIISERDNTIATMQQTLGAKAGKIQSLEEHISASSNCVRAECIENRVDLKHANVKIQHIEEENKTLKSNLETINKDYQEIKTDLAVAENEKKHLKEHIENVHKVSKQLELTAFNEAPNPTTKKKYVRFADSIGNAEEMRNLMRETEQAQLREGEGGETHRQETGSAEKGAEETDFMKSLVSSFKKKK